MEHDNIAYMMPGPGLHAVTSQQCSKTACRAQLLSCCMQVTQLIPIEQPHHAHDHNAWNMLQPVQFKCHSVSSAEHTEELLQCFNSTVSCFSSHPRTSHCAQHSTHLSSPLAIRGRSPIASFTVTVRRGAPGKSGTAVYCTPPGRLIVS